MITDVADFVKWACPRPGHRERDNKPSSVRPFSFSRRPVSQSPSPPAPTPPPPTLPVTGSTGNGFCEIRNRIEKKLPNSIPIKSAPVRPSVNQSETTGTGRTPCIQRVIISNNYTFRRTNHGNVKTKQNRISSFRKSNFD